MPKITIEIDDTVYRLLEVLTKGAEVTGAQTVKDVLLTLVDHAQQGVYRPGAWEREWLERVFPEGWQEHLEPGDPYGRPDSPMFRRPRKNPPMQLYRRRELTDSWTLVVCDAHTAEFGPFLRQKGFRHEGQAPKNHLACTFCLSPQTTVDEIERCTCVDSRSCPVHIPK
jgi:hypothetical protein